MRVMCQFISKTISERLGDGMQCQSHMLSVSNQPDLFPPGCSSLLWSSCQIEKSHYSRHYKGLLVGKIRRFQGLIFSSP